MKTKLLLLGALALVAAGLRAADTPSGPAARIGIYDSRAVAYAYFFTAPATQHRNDLMARAKSAKAAGENAAFAQLNAELVALQKRDHLQVFSTAPAEQAMAALQARVPALLNELQVSRLVSKWDEPGLQAVPAAERVDVTDRLVREFLPAPTPRQEKVLAAMRSSTPLPLPEATRLADEGRM